MIVLQVSGGGLWANWEMPTVQEAKRFAAETRWTIDPDVRTFRAFLAINDYDARIVHEYDAERHVWYECEMWEGATPKVRR